MVASCTSPQTETTTTGADATTSTVSTTAGPTTTQAPDRVTAWNQDLDLLVERLELIHPDPYWRVGEAGFAGRVAALRDAVPTSTDDELELGLIELMATIDGHTLVPTFPPPLSYRRYQIRFYQFVEGVYVVESPDPALVGAELISVDGVPAAEAVEAVTPYVSRDNRQTVSGLAPLYLVMADVLAGAGVVDDPNHPGFTLRTADGSTTTIDPVLLGVDTWDAWATSPVTLPGGTGPISGENTGDAYWWRHLPGSGTVYIGYNLVAAGVGPMVDEIAPVVEAESVHRVVIDLRRNPGGNNTTFGPLLDYLTELDASGEVDVIALIGRHTFSAAANFVTRLDVGTDTVFIGEGIGGRPNLFGDVVPVVLPNSGVTVLISARYWEMGGPGDDRTTVPPDIAIPVTAADYFGGLDPALDAALAYPDG